MLNSKKLKNSKLNATQKIICSELATKGITGKTDQQIAEENNINRVTLWRWKQDPEFNDYLQAVCDEVQRSTLADAFAVLNKLLHSDNEKTSIKAVELVLKNQGRLKDTVDANVEVNNNTVDPEALFKELGL